jgi:hypothetical protein
MPNPFGSSPHFGSVNWGADRVRRLLDREEREKRARRSFADVAPSDPEDTPLELEPEHHLGSTAWGAQQFQRLMDQDERPPATGLLEPSVSPVAANAPADPDDYGWPDFVADVRADKAKEYENYVAANAAISEMVGSQLPGREAGPADAYRHIMWAAEMTRRFGEERAREMLGLHELEGELLGQADDDTAMDASNNEIGVQIGIGARTYEDVISAARKAISGSAADGGGAWKPDYDPTSTMAPHAAQWLPEERWANNPKFDVPRRYPFPALPPQEMPTQSTNWYSNPIRPNGPDWDDGYVPDSYSYPYGSSQHATGPDDPAMLRARNAYRFLDDHPWLVWLKGMQ